MGPVLVTHRAATPTGAPGFDGPSFAGPAFPAPAPLGLPGMGPHGQPKKSETEMLMSRLTEVECQYSTLVREVTTMQSQLSLKNSEGDELRSEIVDLKNRLTVRSAFIHPNFFPMVELHKY